MQASMQAPPLGEADVPQLLQLLHGALSMDAGTQKQAEALLASLESRVGFCSCLAVVIGSNSADHSARWLAAVQLKNVVNKHWRPRYSSGGLAAEEKAYLRGRLLELLVPQEDSQIALQIALTVAKAARFDFPASWPGLLTDLLAAAGGAAALGAGATASSADALRGRRTCLALHYVTKELASKRLAADQRAFAQVTTLLFEPVWQGWCSLLDQLLVALPAALAAQHPPPPELPAAFERWLLLLKVLRRLLLLGFPSDAKTLQPAPAVMTVAPQLLAAAGALQAAAATAAATAAAVPACGPAAAPLGQLSAMVERGVLKLVKSLGQLQGQHPWAMQRSGVLLPALEACHSALLGAAVRRPPQGGAREAVLTASACFLLAVLQCDAYAGRQGQSGGDQAALQQASIEVSGQLAAWWAAACKPLQLPALAAADAAAGGETPPAAATRAGALLLALLAGHLALTARDLDEWEEDGEGWAHARAEADGGEPCDGLRSAARALLVALLAAQPDTAPRLLAHALHGAAAALHPGFEPPLAAPGSRAAAVGGESWLHGPGRRAYPASLLLKEAALDTAALCSYQLHGLLRPHDWLHGMLLPELEAAAALLHQPPPRPLPLLGRGAARLVGALASELQVTDRPAAAAALVRLLVTAAPGGGPEPDAAAALASAEGLRCLVDDFGFDASQLTPVLPELVAGLLGLVSGSQELDTQSQAFGVLNLTIERLGPDLGPHAGAVLAALPAAWAAGAEQSLLRIQVLSCAALLVNALGEASCGDASAVVLPLLSEALAPGGRQPELLEDGLALWLVALRNVPGHLGAGCDAAAAAGALLDLAPALTACLRASTEHIALGMSVLHSLLLLGGAPLLAAHGSHLLAAVAEYVGDVVPRGLLLLLPPVDLLLIAAPQQAAPLLQQFMQRLLATLLTGREPGYVVAAALPLFARLLLQHPAAFGDMLGAAAAAGVAAPSPHPPGPEGLLLALAALMCDAFDSISAPLARKLTAAGLAALLGLPVKGLLQQLPVLLPPITAVWAELEANGADDPASERGEMLYASGLWSGGAAGWSCDAEGGGHDAAALSGLVASEEAAGEAARRAALRDAEPLRGVRLSRLLADKLAAAAMLHGPELHAAMAALDPEVAGQVQTVLAAAAACVHAQS